MDQPGKVANPARGQLNREKIFEEHLCVVALTSNVARNPVLSACLLTPCVIAYCSSSTSR